MEKISLGSVVEIVLAAFAAVAVQLRREQDHDLVELRVTAHYPGCAFVPVYKTGDGLFREWHPNFAQPLPKGIGEGVTVYQSAGNPNLFLFKCLPEGAERIEDKENPLCWVQVRSDDLFGRLTKRMSERARLIGEMDLAIATAEPMLVAWTSKGDFSHRRQPALEACFSFVSDPAVWRYAMMTPANEALRALVEQIQATTPAKSG